jgi:hypothetical protein
MNLTSLQTFLLLSLFLADFVNSTFNFTSGILRLSAGLYPGVFCTIEGFVGQMSVQASDFSTFALASVTYYVAQVHGPFVSPSISNFKK